MDWLYQRLKRHCYIWRIFRTWLHKEKACHSSIISYSTWNFTCQSIIITYLAHLHIFDPQPLRLIACPQGHSYFQPGWSQLSHQHGHAPQWAIYWYYRMTPSLRCHTPGEHQLLAYSMYSWWLYICLGLLCPKSMLLSHDHQIEQFRRQTPLQLLAQVLMWTSSWYIGGGAGFCRPQNPQWEQA